MLKRNKKAWENPNYLNSIREETERNLANRVSLKKQTLQKVNEKLKNHYQKLKEDYMTYVDNQIRLSASHGQNAAFILTVPFDLTPIHIKSYEDIEKLTLDNVCLGHGHKPKVNVSIDTFEFNSQDKDYPLFEFPTISDVATYILSRLNHSDENKDNGFEIKKITGLVNEKECIRYIITW